jgi:quercetin dioxygenase-like cupin family protein
MRNEPEPRRRAYARGPDDGHWIWWLGGALRYLTLGAETRGRYVANVGGLAAGGGPAPHVHSREIECFYLVDGGPVAFTAGNQQVTVGARGFVALCPGTAHRFRAEGDGTIFLFCAPAGFDAFQLEAGEPIPDVSDPRPVTDEDKARVAATAARYGVTMMPGDAYFAREPVAVVSRPGEGARESAPGVTVRQLADGSRPAASSRWPRSSWPPAPPSTTCRPTAPRSGCSCAPAPSRRRRRAGASAARWHAALSRPRARAPRCA